MLKLCEVSRNSCSNQFWKFQLSILKNKKVLSLKKYCLSCFQYQNKQDVFSDQIFSEGFALFLQQAFISLYLPIFTHSTGRAITLTRLKMLGLTAGQININILFGFAIKFNNQQVLLTFYVSLSWIILFPWSNRIFLKDDFFLLHNTPLFGKIIVALMQYG